MEIDERDDEIITRRILLFECVDKDGNAFLRFEDAFKDRKEAEWFGQALQELGKQVEVVARGG